MVLWFRQLRQHQILNDPGISHALSVGNTEMAIFLYELMLSGSSNTNTILSCLYDGCSSNNIEFIKYILDQQGYHHVNTLFKYSSPSKANTETMTFLINFVDYQIITDEKCYIEEHIIQQMTQHELAINPDRQYVINTVCKYASCHFNCSNLFASYVEECTCLQECLILAINNDSVVITSSLLSILPSDVVKDIIHVHIGKALRLYPTIIRTIFNYYPDDIFQVLCEYNNSMTTKLANDVSIDTLAACYPTTTGTLYHQLANIYEKRKGYTNYTMKLV